MERRDARTFVCPACGAMVELKEFVGSAMLAATEKHERHPRYLPKTDPKNIAWRMQRAAKESKPRPQFTTPPKLCRTCGNEFAPKFAAIKDCDTCRATLPNDKRGGHAVAERKAALLKARRRRADAKRASECAKLRGAGLGRISPAEASRLSQPASVKTRMANRLRGRVETGWARAAGGME